MKDVVDVSSSSADPLSVATTVRPHNNTNGSHANDKDDNEEAAIHAASETRRRAARHKRYIESLLDGSDEITIAAKTKRASRVGPGMFVESNIQFFGETVVLWDTREFMEITKWREDAMRRSRGMKKDVVVVGRGVGNGCRKRKDNQSDVVRREEKEESDVVVVDKIHYLSRKKRFRALCQQWYQRSLMEG